MSSEELIGSLIYDSDKYNSRRPVEYKIEGLLGIGGFGRVLKVSRSKYDLREGKEVTKFFALKTIPKCDILNDKMLRRRVITEIKLHRQLNHKHICKFEHSFDDADNVNILLEYCPNTSLQNLLRIRRQPLTEFEVRYYMFQVLQGLMYLKRQKIVHRDLTLSNIFLSENYTVKVGDLGLSFKETCDDERRGKVCGTQPYLAPEIIGNLVTYSYKTDIWAFGIDIFELLTGRLLFESPEQAIEKLPNFSFDRTVKISDEARNLLLKIFVKEQDRIDLQDIYNHPFFNQGINIGSDIEIPRYEIIGEDTSKDKLAQIEKAFREEIDELAKNITITFNKDTRGLIKRNANENGLKIPALKLKVALAEGKNTVVINPFAEILNPNTNDKVSILVKGWNTKMNTNPSMKLSNDKRKMNDDNNDSLHNNHDDTIEMKRNKTVERASFKLNTISDIKINQSNFIQSIKNNNNSNSNCTKANIEIVNESCLPSRNIITNVFNNNNYTCDNNPDFLKQSLENMNTNTNTNRSSSNTHRHLNTQLNNDEIIIVNYIDESRKYGIGYELNNGLFGVYFNDGAKMVSNTKELFYWTKESKTGYTSHSLPLKDNYGLSATNGITANALRTKYQVLTCFSNEFNRQKKEKLQLKPHKDKNKIVVNGPIVHLRKWKRASKGMLFLLSNKNVQANFYDKSKIVFQYEKKSVKYFDQMNTSQEYNAETLYNVDCLDEEINNKISYAIKEFLKGC